MTSNANESPRAAKGNLRDLLLSLSRDERASRKGDEFAKQRQLRWRPHPSAPGVEFSCSKPEKIVGGFEVIVRARRDGEEVDLSAENPFRFINPPILVPTGRKVAAKSAEGRDVTVDELEENPASALEVIVADAVSSVLKGK